MPHKMMTEGKVVATKPLSYSGKVIEDFYLEFKDGVLLILMLKRKRSLTVNFRIDQKCQNILLVRLL